MFKGRALRPKLVFKYLVNNGQTHFGEKLKIVCDLAPIHSPRSSALASDTPHATMRVGTFVWNATYLVLEITTSYVGPISPPTC